MKLYILLVSVLWTCGILCHPVDNSDEFFKSNENLPGIVQGDIFVTEEQKEEFLSIHPSEIQYGDIQGAVQKQDKYKWPENTIPYMISSAFTADEIDNLLKPAMRDIESKTCIRFQEVSSPPESKTYLHIIDGSGCWSYVGRVFRGDNKEQQLSIRRASCKASYIVIHELVHAIGAWHEQSRPDRDHYITIHPENMYEGTEANFQIQSDTYDQNSPYDPQSIMHYVKTAFSKNGEPTITWNDDPSMPLGGKVLTDSDVYQINAYYGCGTGPTPKTTTTTTRKPITTTTTTTTRKPTTTTTTTTRKPTTTTTTTTRKPTTTTTTTTTRKPKTTTTTTTRKPTTTTTTTTRKPTTTTTTRTSTSTPIIEGCGDSSFECLYPHYHRRYYCKEQKYRDMCPQSCKLCDGGDKLQCGNFKNEPDFDCYNKGMEGHCTAKYKLRWAMKNNCPKTCCEEGVLFG